MLFLDAISVKPELKPDANSNKKPTKLFSMILGTCLVGLCVPYSVLLLPELFYIVLRVLL